MAARLLDRLSRLNRTAVFLGTAAAVFWALLVGGWFGFVVLMGLSAVLAALAAVHWTGLPPGGRAVRVVVIAFVLAVAAFQLTR